MAPRWACGCWARQRGPLRRPVPLLAKLIDAADRLSVQVHPDDAYALTHEAASGHLGKSEAWYVLEAEPGAHVLWGFRQDVDADRCAAPWRTEACRS